MNLKRISIELSVSDVQNILKIALDEDAGEALAFIKKDLSKRVMQALQPR